jgi:hypothetical protein
MFKYIAAWFPMIPIAIANGAIREAWYGKHLSELRAHQVSTGTGMLLFGIYIWMVIKFWRPESSDQAVAIGFLWLGLTLAFEFLFGHYVAGHSWNRLIQDYNILAGRVWLLFLVWITVAAYLFYRVQQ